MATHLQLMTTLITLLVTILIPLVHGQLKDSFNTIPYDRCQTRVDNRFCFGSYGKFFPSYPAGTGCFKSKSCWVVVYAEVSPQPNADGHNIYWYLFTRKKSQSIFWLATSNRTYVTATTVITRDFIPNDTVYITLDSNGTTATSNIESMSSNRDEIAIPSGSPEALNSFKGIISKDIVADVIGHGWVVAWTSKSIVTVNSVTLDLFNDVLYPNIVEYNYTTNLYTTDLRIEASKELGIFYTRPIPPPTTTTTTTSTAAPDSTTTKEGTDDSNASSTVSDKPQSTDLPKGKTSHPKPEPVASNTTTTIIVVVVVIALVVIATIGSVFYVRKREEKRFGSLDRSKSQWHSEPSSLATVSSVRTPMQIVVPVMVPVMMPPTALPSNSSYSQANAQSTIQNSNYSLANDKSQQYSMVNDKSEVATRLRPSTALDSTRPSTSPSTAASTATKASNVQDSSVSTALSTTGGLSTYFKKD